MNTDKWKKAVVHLECKGSSLDGSYDTWGRRGRGTAIFLLDEDKYYLLTAKHVVFDEEEFAHAIANQNRFFLERTYEKLFRIRSLDEIRSVSQHEIEGGAEFLFNLAVGIPDLYPFTFSNSELDLAIISLRGRHFSDFTNELLRKGYVPISIDDVANGPLREGQKVFSVGYPETTSVLGNYQIHTSLSNWSSNAYSVPIFSFGRVAMMHESLSFFWADMSIYPGNSGGPVVANNKLIGIISAQATIKVDGGVEKLTTRIPFAVVIKAENILALLGEQRIKDERAGE